MTPLAQLKLVACAVLLAVLAYLIYDYTTLSSRNDKLAEENRETKDQLADVSRRLETVSEEMVTRAEFDAGVRKRRAQTQSRINEVSNEASPAGDYLRERIPDGVRETYRQ
ncbi:hypothetical protein AZ78_1287 [Lysobacter capsici AZ78]|uniref:Uncharacterized protein n=1 Tax=Lysobacter capsici AZ78 TaxID=1444315 RepID=A0A120AFY4_9GAMM|nr:hypothetical protein [Lysobacter capsici]KWS03738.1 hypothetical protein AZ78_1287 [Lysobacter capsici AZ78]